MREFVITTESNSDLPSEYIDENEIGVIPHYYSVEETIYGEEKKLSIHEFYNEMRREKKVATMASNPAVIYETFEKYAKEGKDILHISFSSTLSGGYGNICTQAEEIKEEYPDTKILVLDTCSGSLGEGLLIMTAVDLQKEGKTIQEIYDELEKLKKNVHVIFTVDDLSALYRGGRLKKSTAIMGNVIKIKPILEIEASGKLVPTLKVRGRKKSMLTLVDEMERQIGEFRKSQVMVGVVHGDCEEEANNLSSMIKARFGYEYICICPIGPSIGAHTGPGTLGVVFLGEERKNIIES